MFLGRSHVSWGAHVSWWVTCFLAGHMFLSGSYVSWRVTCFLAGHMFLHLLLQSSLKIYIVNNVWNKVAANW